MDIEEIKKQLAEFEKQWDMAPGPEEPKKPKGKAKPPPTPVPPEPVPPPPIPVPEPVVAAPEPEPVGVGTSGPCLNQQFLDLITALGEEFMGIQCKELVLTALSQQIPKCPPKEVAVQ